MIKLLFNLKESKIFQFIVISIIILNAITIGVNTYDGTTGVATVGSITGTQTGSGSFSFAQSFTKGDIAGTASEYSDFGSVTITSAGTQNSSANAPGTVTAAHAITLTGTGNIGSTTTGQFVSEVTIFD